MSASAAVSDRGSARQHAARRGRSVRTSVPGAAGRDATTGGVGSTPPRPCRPTLPDLRSRWRALRACGGARVARPASNPALPARPPPSPGPEGSAGCGSAGHRATYAERRIAFDPRVPRGGGRPHSAGGDLWAGGMLWSLLAGALIILGVSAFVWGGTDDAKARCLAHELGVSSSLIDSFACIVRR